MDGSSTALDDAVDQEMIPEDRSTAIEDRPTYDHRRWAVMVSLDEDLQDQT